MNEMAQIDDAKSKLSVITGDIPLDNLSGWVLWEIVIVASFVFLSALTAYFFLAKSGLLKRKRKKKRVSRKPRKSLSLGFQKKRPKIKTKQRVKAKRVVRKRSKPHKPILKKEKKRYTGNTKRKSGTNPKKMPFMLDPSVIRSYTSKYLAREKIKATWEKVLLAGVDCENNRLDLAAYLLTKEFGWQLGAADRIECNQSEVSPKKLFKNKEVKQIFQKAAGLISVGIVTELAEEKQKEGLAQARAEKMVAWLKKSLPHKKVDFLLNLESPLVESGEAVEAVTQPEIPRPVLWICLQPYSEEMDVEEALKDALSRAIQLPFDFDSYQKVSLINICN
jgi:hypothetical protein